jgi:hypothetical protein
MLDESPSGVEQCIVSRGSKGSVGDSFARQQSYARRTRAPAAAPARRTILALGGRQMIVHTFCIGKWDPSWSMMIQKNKSASPSFFK